MLKSPKELEQKNYWLVEVNKNKENDHIQRFKAEGIWVNTNYDKFSNLLRYFKPGDLIAIKSSVTVQMEDNKYVSFLRVKAVGTIMKNYENGKFLEVNWEKEKGEYDVENIINNETVFKLINIDEINAIFFPDEYSSNSDISVYEPKKEQEESEPENEETNLIEKPLTTTATITHTEKEHHAHKIHKETSEHPKKTHFHEKEPVVISENIKVKHPLNQIFYGPSGSGKTFKTLTTALEIIDGFYSEDPSEAKNKFDYYHESGQIGFITFHERYSYDEFVEGLRPLIMVETGQVTYQVKSGIFKEISNLAKAELASVSKKLEFEPNLEKTKFFKVSIGKHSKEKDNSTLNYCFENNYVVLDMQGGLDYSILENTPDWEKAKEEIESVHFFDDDNEKKRQDVQSIFFFKNYMKRNDIIFVSNNNDKIIGIARITGIYDFKDIAGVSFHHFRKVEWLIKDCSIPCEKFYKVKFSDQPIYELSKRNLLIDNISNFIGAAGSRKRNYVLIIDEINKGDIGKVFGELVTLIEPQRRLGQPEELTVKLPYSNEEFGIPPNLYIIGTMNSSSKEDLFDNTLRRRFHFIELEIDYKQLSFKIDGIEVDKMLEMINKRITFLTDGEFQIGHSYFTELKDSPSFENLKLVFKNKILPLLQYYFSDNVEKVRLILGDNQKKDKSLQFFSVDKMKGTQLFGKAYKSEKDIYLLNIPEKPEAYIKIYS